MLLSDQLAEAVSASFPSDKASIAKYGVVWRTTDSGHRVGLDPKTGQAKFGNPHVIGGEGSDPNRKTHRVKPTSTEKLTSHFRDKVPMGNGVQTWAAEGGDTVNVTIMGDPYLRIDAKSGKVTYRDKDMKERLKKGWYNKTQAEKIGKGTADIQAALRSLG